MGIINLSKRLDKISDSATLAISAKSKEMRRKGRSIIDLSVGEPDFDTPWSVKEAAFKAIKDGFTKYTPTVGIPELIQAICDKFRRDNQLDYGPSQIIVSAGAKQALYNAILAICNPGDEVIIPQPFWVSYPEQVKLAGATPVPVSTYPEAGFRIGKDYLKRKITSKTKLFILNSPCNPTGAVYPREDLNQIAELICSYELYLIFDEIYEKLVYERKHWSIASLGKEIKEKTITVNGLSKTYSMTGWRIGYAAGPEEIIQGMKKIQSHSTSCPNSVAQIAALSALKGPQDEVERRGEIFARRRNLIVDRLKKIEGVSCFSPQGAFYVFPDFSSFFEKRYNHWIIKNSLDLAGYLLEEAGVAVVPGIAFGADHYLRLSYAASIEEIDQGLNRIEEALSLLK
jgi:aspartate aminotransferase